jgi:hypothetical protein
MKTGDNRRFAYKAQPNMVDVFTIVFALIILVAVARRLRPVRPITVFFLALLTGAWIWANLHDFGSEEEWGNDFPEGLDPVTKAVFYRGWPLAPFMLCLVYFNRFHAGGGVRLDAERPRWDAASTNDRSCGGRRIIIQPDPHFKLGVAP